MKLEMNFWTLIGLGIALVGPSIIALYKKRSSLGFDSLIPKFLLWVLVILISLILFNGENENLQSIGFNKITLRTFYIGIIGGIGMMIIMAIVQMIFRKQKASGGEYGYKDITSLSFNRRVFSVITASIVEEFLFRGYAIERLALITSNIWIAALISTLFFTIAHAFSWSIRHLIPVFLTGLFLASIYIMERDIIACIIAHFFLDSVAFLLMPYLIEKKNKSASGI
ncbi:MAG: CPBP family intramembrane metalloprotease [Cyclobacteriaceae bacterium]|nr:CPBP family intramembrane metalloprotease [Cyclobacteriaceae bacterium]